MTLLSVRIQDKSKTVFTGEVEAVSSTNELGNFDILPEHKSYVSLVKEKVTIHKTDGQKLEFPLGRGLLQIHQNIVRVFLDLEVMETQTGLTKNQSTPKIGA